MPGQAINVSPNLPIDLEITIGQAQWGQYKIYLWDSTGTKYEQIGQGLNTDNIPDKFQVIKPAAGYAGLMISWEVNIAAYNNGPGQKYSVAMRFSQGGQPVPNGVISQNGDLPGGAKALMDFVRLTEA